ncbi:MAG: PHB depolymerase family esterase [Pseudomonadota bacterium]
MNERFADAMRRALGSVRAMQPLEATAIIQEALAAAAPGTTGAVAAKDGPEPAPRPAPNLRLVGPADQPDAPTEAAVPARKFPRRARRPLGEVVRALQQARRLVEAPTPSAGAVRARETTLVEGARFEARTFSCAAGSRAYRLYVPSCGAEAVEGLLVMLHGCQQDPDDFAAGTNMNVVAERERLIVVYPGQSARANLTGCWNWFEPAHQGRDDGEPLIIASLTHAMVAEFGVPPGRTFVAGLSAGGAMAAVMGETFPELYAAVGVHSGVPCGLATDLASGFAAMRGDGATTEGTSRPDSRPPRLIVFHGTNDPIVAPANADRFMSLARNAHPASRASIEHGVGAGRRGYARTRQLEDGRVVAELWLVEGAGHAWSGGNPAGSYADAAGPDASAEMVRFFLDDQ